MSLSQIKQSAHRCNSEHRRLALNPGGIQHHAFSAALRFGIHPMPECRVSLQLVVVQRMEIRRRIRNRTFNLMSTDLRRNKVVKKFPLPQESLPATDRRLKMNRHVIDGESELLVILDDRYLSGKADWMRHPLADLGSRKKANLSAGLARQWDGRRVRSV